jgi:plastocyanin
MRRVATLLLVGTMLAACQSASAAPATVIEMLDNSYSPSELTVTAGMPVTFVGVGRNPHNAVAADGSWSTEDTFGSLEQFEGDEATVVVEEPGTYVFFCTFHGNAEGRGMAGTLVVVAPEDASS